MTVNKTFFKVSLGYSIFYLSIIVIIPLSILFLKASNASFDQIIDIISSDRTIKAFQLTIFSSLISALINAVMGLVIAFIIVKYNFFGKKIIDGLIDLPFALPTSIAGIALVSIYGKNGILGKFFYKLNIELVYNQTGIVIALIFVGLPFVVRNVEPALRIIDKEFEEAASCLGATKYQIFTKIILPSIMPSLLSGFTLAFARGLGEFGSVIFIAGNVPRLTEVTSLLIYIKLEQYDYESASIIAILALTISFIMIFIVNICQKWSNKYHYA